MRSRAVLAVASVLLVTACATGLGASSSGHTTTQPPTTGGATADAPPASAAGTPAPLTIYGAASLKGVLERVRAAYESTHPGVTITLSTDSSAALETQIEQGAPADLFLSADTANPQKLVDKGLADGSPMPFAGNLLTVIVPSANPAKIASPADLARSGVRVIAAGDPVPITGYAKRLVANLARQPGYPADYPARYAANVASKEDNVAAVLAKIELGEGDAAIVYLTDAKTGTGIATVPVPADANVVATYAGVVVGASPNRAAAQAILRWLAGPDGQAVLGEAGFVAPA